MKFNLTYLEELNGIISSNDCFYKRKKKTAKTKKSKGFTYQYYNQICACIIRIRDTYTYLDEFKFRKENICGQAFDFYEFINCASIIEGCIKVLFNIFDKKVKDFYPNKQAFYISNRTNNNDIAFFNFIRSASSMHPAETTAHSKITKHKFEVYPYAIWINKNIRFLKCDIPKDAEIQLLSWNCKTNGKYRYYYLVISEFYSFLANLADSIQRLIPIVNEIVEENKSKLRCKVLKKQNDFSTISDYCLYLRQRLYSKLKKDDFPDGGLLLASNILSNNLVGDDFKKYIQDKISTIREKMLNNIESIEYDEIFADLSLSSILSSSNRYYVSEKFHDYLYEETIKEIENNEYIDFKQSIRYEENNLNYSNSEWSVFQLLHCNNDKINNVVEKSRNYVDLYELILELIYLEGRKL